VDRAARLSRGGFAGSFVVMRGGRLGRRLSGRARRCCERAGGAGIGRGGDWPEHRGGGVGRGDRGFEPRGWIGVSDRLLMANRDIGR
jgi:hypothetical protein